MKLMDAGIFGLIVADLIAEPMDLRNPPAPGGLVRVNSIRLTTGGNVCNTGTAMARLGMHVAAAGLVGDDALGRAVLEKLRSTGVEISGVGTTSRAQTSATVVAVEPGGERCFFHTVGATAMLDAATFRAAFETFKRCAFVQIGYFGLLPGLRDDLPRLLSELREASPRTRIALDTVNPPDTWQRLAPILPRVDIFCPSRSEAQALTGLSSPAEMASVFRRHMPADGLVGIKLDAEGCYLDDGRQQVTAGVYPVKVVDTTGAGDTWFAGLLTALRKQMPLEPAARFANRVAADCCTALGASDGVRDFEQTLSRL